MCVYVIMENNIGNHIVFLLISGKHHKEHKAPECFFVLRDWAELVLVRHGLKPWPFLPASSRAPEVPLASEKCPDF